MKVMELFPPSDVVQYHNHYFSYRVEYGEHVFTAESFYLKPDGSAADLVVRFSGLPDERTRKGLLDPTHLL